jgi:outer membrane protein
MKFSLNRYAVIAALLLPLTLLAQELKIGFVDTAQLMKDSPQAEAARKKLESEFKPRDQKIVEMQKEEKQYDEQLTRDGNTMSETERKRLERNIQSVKRDIKRAREEFFEDYNLRRNEEISRLQKLIDKIAIEIAREEHFDLIVRDNVLYASKRITITDKVLERLRQQYKPDKSASEPISGGSSGK